MRRLLAWLARRFPVQLVVTVQEYERLQDGMNGLSNSIVALNQRLGAAETQLRRLNESQGFNNPLTKAGVRLER